MCPDEAFQAAFARNQFAVADTSADGHVVTRVTLILALCLSR
jgi:hypothetical protein